MKNLGHLLLLISVAVGTAFTMIVPGAAKFQEPDLARLVFFHLPCALVSAALMTLAPYFGLRYLQSNQRHWEVRMTAAMELGMLTGILTLVTGMLFSKVQWGTWWNWDPRQSSYLMVMFIAGAFFAIRGAMDTERRGPYSSTYLMAAVLPIIFLVFVYPKLPVVKSLHPNVIAEGSFDMPYRLTFYSMFLLVGLVVAWAYHLRVRAELLEIALENRNAKLADRNHSAAPRVVRPLPVSPSGQSAAGENRTRA